MTKEQAIINALAHQRNEALNAAANLMADLALAHQRIQELENPKETDNGSPDQHN